MTKAAAPDFSDATKCIATRKKQKNGEKMSEADTRFLQLMACNYPDWFDETSGLV